MWSGINIAEEEETNAEQLQTQQMAMEYKMTHLQVK
jgi:hypothetical protein